MAGKKLGDCQSGQDFVKYARSHGAEVRANGGSHQVVKYGRSSIAVPVHGAKPLGKGLRHVLVKAFTAAGLLIVLAACILQAL
jgi:predicted RNA binding protein YcfA (HicA-like mRNA interferase family)